MVLKRKIKVLVIDDSMLFRETIARGLSADEGLEVVGKAADPFIARDMIISLEPDVLTLDVEMPRMNGIEFLKRLMPQYPLPVVVVSSVSQNVFDALNAGAVDFVTKPGPGAGGQESLIRELIVKIKIASTARVGSLKRATPVGAPVGTGNGAGTGQNCDLIAIGASTGGTEAVCDILKNLPREMPPILIVQHMPPVFTRMYAERLNNSCPLTVSEAVDGAAIHPGEAWLAAGDCHMTLQRRPGRGLFIESRPGERMNGHCPSVDMLFNSVSTVQQQAGLATISILLTGMGYDGAKGLLALKKAGSLTICQDEATSVVYGMPKVAWDIGAALYQSPLDEIPELICESLHNPKEMAANLRRRQ